MYYDLAARTEEEVYRALGLAWIPLGIAGWFTGIFLSSVEMLRSDGVVSWLIPFGSYALAVLPAVLGLRRDGAGTPPPLP